MRFTPGTGCPSSLKKLAATCFTQQGHLKRSAYQRFDQLLKKASAMKHDLRCYEDALAFIAEVRDRAHLDRCIKKAFPGQVPGHKRKELIGQFKRDPECRVFLSTDAGGVGLNLQNACTVINMDLP